MAMNSRHMLWFSALAEYVPPLAIVSGIGRGLWRPGEERHRQALQSVATSLCNVVASDRRYPNEVRRNHPHGGRLVLDILTRSCTHNEASVATIGMVDRLNSWLLAELDDSQIPGDRICGVRVEVEYTAAERTYIASGRVWEMQFSLRSEVETPDQSYVGVTPGCMASVPYGIGAAMAW
jgi:hypothetical protein